MMDMVRKRNVMLTPLIVIEALGGNGQLTANAPAALNHSLQALTDATNDKCWRVAA